MTILTTFTMMIIISHVYSILDWKEHEDGKEAGPVESDSSSTMEKGSFDLIIGSDVVFNAYLALRCLPHVIHNFLHPTHGRFIAVLPKNRWVCNTS